MNITLSHEQGRVPVTVFHLDGELTAEDPLFSRAQQVHSSGTQFLLLDLSKVAYISSAGLRSIHNVFSLFRADDETDESTIASGIMAGTYTSPNLKLYKPTKNAKKALHVAGYDMFLEIQDNYKKAINSF